MAKKISELTTISSLSESDVLPIVDVSANTTNKVTLAKINENVNTTIGDLSDLETTDKTSIVNAINEVNAVNFMVAYPSSNQTLNQANSIITIDLNTRGNYNGDKLTFNSSSKGIVIGAGVHIVEVVGMIYVSEVGSASLKNVYIYKNDDMVARELLYFNQSYQMIQARNIIFVSEGDIITLRANSQFGNTTIISSGSAVGLNGTALLVRVLG